MLKPASMTREDYLSILQMISAGALLPLKGSQLLTGGWVMVYCPDGDCTPEAIQFHHFRLCPEANGNNRVCTHLAPLTGGPGAIPRESPMNRMNYKGNIVATADQTAFSTIEGALKIKGARIENLGLVPHCACGMAQHSGLSVWDNFHLTFRAAEIIESEFPGQFKSIEVMPHITFVGFDEGKSGEFKTYRLVRDVFMRLYESRTRRSLEPELAERVGLVA